MNPRFLISLVTLLTLSGSLERQELRIKSRVSVPSVSAQIVTGRSRCDPDKNVFLSPGNLGGGMPTTVLKISPDGQKITRYEFGSTPDLGSVVLVEYAIGPDSEVRALVSRQDGTKYLSSFDTAGKYIGSSRIEMSYFTPGLLAVLPAGNVLISGSERAEPGANLPFQPFFGIFNSRGQLVKKVVPQNDLEPPKLSGAAEDRRKLAQHHLSLISGMAETSQQGEVYVSRLTATGPVLVVSPSGELVRTLHLQPPENGWQLRNIALDGRTLAAEYQGRRPPEGTVPVRVRIFDNRSGKLIKEYSHQNHRIGVFTCYSGSELTFFSAGDDGRLQIVRAGPE